MKIYGISIFSWTTFCMKVIKKLFGLDKIEANIEEARLALEQANKLKEEAEKNLKEITQEQELAKLSPKDRATRKKEPWVGVLNTHVNKENVRNGFFELDWNDKFIVKFEAGPMEQVFKYNQVDVKGLEGLKIILNEGFIEKTRQRFNDMFLQWKQN